MRRFTQSILTIALCATLSAAASAQEPTILVGMHAGIPAKASIGIGTGKSVGVGRLLFMMFEPGVAGGRVSIGLAGLSWRPMTTLRATLLRTWGDPVGAVRDRNYLGPELQLMGPYGIGLRGGLLFRTDRARTPTTSLGVSFGF